MSLPFLITSLLLAPSATAAKAAAAASSPRPPTPNRPAEATTATSRHRRPPSPRRSLQKREERYEILPSAAILDRMETLAAAYPEFVTLTTTQEWFGLPRAGSDKDCPFDKNYPVNGKGCNNYVLILQDKEAYPEDPDVQRLAPNALQLLELEGGWFKEGDGKPGDRSGWRHVPDVFLSGAVHGNERVGPTSLLEMTELLAEAAHCESLPRMKYKPEERDDNATSTNSNQPDTEEEARWKEELFAASSCRTSLDKEKGIPSHHRRWLARLVATRRTIIIPTANALGYSRDQREEDGIDPNRDFPFDIEEKDRSKCMQTTAGRSINELFRSHLFPIGLTFHGGMEVIGYEWGAPTYLNKDAPDVVAQNAIASAYSRYAGAFPRHVAYDFGTMNDKVYYVRGGMEDWAFAGSWDPDRVVKCAPKTLGGYSEEKTKYNNSTLRAFNMLVETSNPKTPSRNELGKRNNPLDTAIGGDNGHIARNIRLALLAMDVVEPYVSIREVTGLKLEDDVVPGVNPRRYGGKSYLENGAIVYVPKGDGDSGNGDGGNSVKLSWTVGGAMDIDETELLYGPWDALPHNLADVDSGAYPSVEMTELLHGPGSSFAAVGSTAGRSRWHAQGPSPTSPAGEGNDPTFEASIDTSAYPMGTKLAVFAKAKVDSSWLVAASNVGPDGLGPVSHLVNARRNPNYYASNAGKVIRGRKDDWWYSAPITVVVGGASGSQEEEQVMHEAQSHHAPINVEAVHVNSRASYLPHAMGTVLSRPPHDPFLGNDDYVSRSSMETSGAPTRRSMPILLGSLFVAFFLVLLLVGLIRRRRRRRLYSQRQRLERVSAEEREEDGFSIGSYRDDPVAGEDDEDAEAGSSGAFLHNEEEEKEK